MKELNEKLKRNKLTKQSKGITLIALVITIIVLLILAGVTIATLTGDNGLLQKAGESKNINEKGQIEEQIKLAYNDWKLRKETGETVDLQNTVQTALDKIYDNVTISKQGKSIIINVKGNEFTLIDDGTMEEGQLACLDIADGNIDLYSNGYKQYTGNLQSLNKNGSTQYTGKYIITGTTTENVVRVCDEGTFDITIKDLNIDARDSGYCAVNANKGAKATGCYVNLMVEGNNYLKGGNGPGLGWTGAILNLEEIKDGGSILTITGNGKLEVYGGNMQWTSAIGNTYSGGDAGGDVNNIIINGGNIKAEGSVNGAGIGSALGGKVNNIVINSGNIEAIGNNCGCGIGGSTADNIIINGGNIIAKGGTHGSGLGGGSLKIGSMLKIKGGNIYAVGGAYGKPWYNDHASAIGAGIENIIIEGGTVKTDSKAYGGLFGIENNNVKITGGNLLLGGIGDIGDLDSNKDFVQGYSTDGTNTLYETQIKLQGVGENKKVTKLTTSDNINYGINDMYTLENGMLYLYLPLGERTITIDVDGKTYSGTVQTTETPVEVTLSETN